MTDKSDELLEALHAHILDPDDGLFARLTEIRVEVREARKAFDDHVVKDRKDFAGVREEIAKVAQKQSGLRGWVLGILAALGVGSGVAGSKIADLLK